MEDLVKRVRPSLRVIGLAACVIVGLSVPGCGSSERAGLGQIKGDYTVVSRLSPHSLERVRVEIAISFECPACYRFDAGMAELSKTFGKRLVVRWVPIARHGASGLPERFYLLAERSGRAEAARHALFHARFKENLDIEQRPVIGTIAARIGMTGEVLAQLDDSTLEKEQELRTQTAREYAFFTPSVLVENQLLVPPDTGALTLVVRDLLVVDQAQSR